MGFFSAVKRFFGQRDSADVSANSQAEPAIGSDGHGKVLSQMESTELSGPAEALSAAMERKPLDASVCPDESQQNSMSACAASQDGESGAPAAAIHEPDAGEMPAHTVLAPSVETAGPDVQEIRSGVPENVLPSELESPYPAVFTDNDSGSLPSFQPAALDGKEDLLLRLRNAEPRLSSWLAIVLEDQDEVNEAFWQRLRFFLQSLEAPSDEVDQFVQEFERWLERMEYAHVDEFRSELQYRLAVALDLEDEEDERNRLLLKLETGLAATRARFGRRLDALFSGHARLDDSFWDEMEELFITADMGYETSLEMVERLKSRAADSGVDEPRGIKELMRAELEELFRLPARIRAANKPEVVLMMGVNGAGKTTTIAKLAYRERLNGRKVLIVAADTFRAAAMEQLKVWADRVGADFYQKPAGADPAAVAWEGMDYALAHGMDVVYVDTAGRLQTRVNLMEELGKIRQVLARKHPGAPHRNVLVLDATTGQNALSQARLFKEAAGADEIILTKLDGTAKGGVAIAVAMREKLPISYVGLGERMEDLRPFNGGDFASALLEESSAA